MKKPNSNDIRTQFLNLILFGTKSTPGTKITSINFANLLKMKDDKEKEVIFNELSRSYLNLLNKTERHDLINIITSNETYYQLLIMVYILSKNNKNNSVDIILAKINDDLKEYETNALITDSVLYYFKIILDRITLFDFENHDKINEEEYLKISFCLLSKNMDDYFIKT